MTTIEGTYLSELFDEVRRILAKWGYDLFTDWRGWKDLNHYYGYGEEGNFLIFEENHILVGFTSGLGSHPLMGSCAIPAGIDYAGLFQELVETFHLTLDKDVDASSPMTYEGHRKLYYRINHPKYRGNGGVSTKNPLTHEKMLKSVYRLIESEKDNL